MMGLFKKDKQEKNNNQKTKQKKLIKYKAIILTILVSLVLLVMSFQSKVVNETISSLRKRILNSQGLYTVSFYDGNGLKLWETTVKEGYRFVEDGEDSEENQTFTYKGPEVPERNSYKFSGWRPNTGSFVINQDTDFTAIYLEDTKYILTVRYIKQNGEVAANTYVELISFGEEFSVDSPEVDGYTTENLNVSGVLTEDTLSQYEEDESVTVEWDEKKTTCTIILTVTYLPEETSYQIIHYKQDTDGIQYIEEERETITDVRVGDIITNVGKEKEYVGFTFNERLSTFDGTVAADGKTEVKMYYDREVYYNYYDTADGEYIEVSPVLYGTNPNVLGVTPTREGYNFTGWKYYKEDENDDSLRTEISLPETMDRYDIIWVAQWEEANNSYSITYWKENANDEYYTNIGMITIDQGIKTGDTANIYDNEATIKEGFNQLSGEGQRDYFFFDTEETVNRNKLLGIDIENFTIKADGSSNINVYYGRNSYTLRFYAGRDNNGSQIASGTNGSEDACSWVNTNTPAKIRINDAEYENNNYTITAKFEQDISTLWPSADFVDDVVATNGSTYHFISWGTSSGTPYYQHHDNKNILGNYATMASELIVSPTDPTQEHKLFGYWSTGQSFYKYHYMLENIDPTSTQGTEYNNKYFTEARTSIVKSTNTRANQNAADFFGYDLKGKTYDTNGTSGGSSIDQAVDIYFFYERHTFTISLVNVNNNYVPTDLSDEVKKNGISLNDGTIVAKYGANITSLKEEYLKWIEDEENPFKNPVVTTGIKLWEFDGWYSDRRYTNNFDWGSDTLTKVSENIVLYAKWKAQTYKISFNLDNGTWNDPDQKYTLENNMYVTEEEEGDNLTEPVEPTRNGYIFDGWYYNQRINGKDYEVKYLFSESQVIYKDVTLTAKWIRIMRASYKVRYIEAEYDDNGQLIEDIKLYKEIKTLAPDKEVNDILVGTIVTEEAIILEGKNELYVVRNRQKSITINNDNIEDNTIYFFYTKFNEVKYTIYYVQDTGIEYQDGEIPEEKYWLEEPTKGTIADEEHILFTATSAFIRGYVPDSVTKTTLLVSDESKNIIVFYYKENDEHGDYIINYHFMKEDGTYSAVPDEQVKGEKGVGSIIYASQYEEYLQTDKYVGHTLDYDLSDSSGVVTSTAEATIINLYFKNQTYTITYHTQGAEVTNEDFDYKITEKDTYQNNFTYPEHIKELTVQKDGCKFLGWYEVLNVNNENHLDLNKFNFDEPITHDTNLYAVWSETKDFTITKIWSDENDRDGLRPENARIELYRNLSLANTLELSEINQVDVNKWQTQINIDKYDYSNSINVIVYEEENVRKIKLDKLDENTEIVEIIPIPQGENIQNDAVLEDVLQEPLFSVREKEVNGYNISYDQETFTVTNTHTIQKVNKKVTKTWVDEENRDRIRPENVTVRLLKNGVQEGEDILLNDANSWTYEWNDLYVNENGNPIDYTVEENPVNEYNMSIENPDENTFNIINTHNPEKVKLLVEKKWIDNNDQDGKRPDSINIKLSKNGVEQEDTQTYLSESNGWKYEYILYKNDDGVENNYEAIEQVPDFYTVEYKNETQGENKKVTITNTHEIEKTNKTIKKNWEDKENQDLLRPQEVYVRLLKNKQELQEIKLTAENGWQQEITNLDVYENGDEIEYTVEETDVPEGYTVNYDLDNLTITNNHKVATTSKTVNIIWNDENNRDGIRPSKVNIKLYANGIEKEEIELSDSQGWTYTWDELDLNENGNPIVYTIELVTDLGEKYTSEKSEDTFTITNTHQKELVSKTAKITWVDNNNQDGKRPDSVTVILLANGDERDRATILKDDKQEYTWNDLDKNEDGEEIVYTVSLEKELQDYNTEYNQENLEIINKHTIEMTNKVITKIWRDSDDKEGFRPDNVEIELYGNGNKVNSVNLSNANKLDDNENNWQYTFTNLPVYEDGRPIVYTVKEPVVPENYGVLYNQEKLTVYNAFPPEVDVSVTKIWEDEDNADGLRPESLWVQLKADGENYMLDGQNIGLVELNEANGWTYKWPFVEKYNEETDEKYVYSIEELDANLLNGYTSTYPVLDEGDYIYTFTIVNKHDPEKVNRKVKIEWEDNENNDRLRPESVKVDLLAGDDIVDTETLDNSNNFTHEWNVNKNKLGKEITYSVKEEVPRGYIADVSYNESDNTFTITNTHKEDTVSKTVEVIWNDKNNQDGFRPTKVNIALESKNGTEGKQITLNALNNWEYTWEDLQKYNEGTPIEYYVMETNLEELEKYTIDYSSEDENKFIITNTHTPETISKTVTKVWEDNNNQDVIRPHSVEVKLKAQNADYENTVTLKENSWTHTWEGLDKYNNGDEIIYEVEELSNLELYRTNYENDENKNFIIKNIHIPNTVRRKITVNWNDKNNQDRVRPDEVTIQLKADGVNYLEPFTINSDSGWETLLEDLPERKPISDGNSTIIHYIEYTAEEVVPNKYSAEVTIDADKNIVITNSYEVEKTFITVEKNWNDKENQDKIRPNMVKVQLKANNENIGKEITLSDQNEWTYTWNDLDKNNNGTEVEYTVDEVNLNEKYSVEKSFNAESRKYTLTNNHTPETISKSVTVVWNDKENQDRKRPLEVRIQLMANGENSGNEIILNEENGWTYTWEDLDKNKQGEEISYTINEVNKDEIYTSNTTYNSDENKFVITKNYTPEKVSRTVRKEWNDNNNSDLTRPDEVTVQLVTNNIRSRTKVVLNEDNNWTYTWENLDKYSGGNLIEYSVEENEIANYSAKYSFEEENETFVIVNTYPPEKVEKTVKTIWNDKNNQDGKRPLELKVQLKANDENIGEEITLNDSNEWTYTWSDLIKNSEGVPIRYYITDISVENYITEISELNNIITITNSYTPETITKNVKVVWNDEEDQDSKRPNQVTVKLKGDGILDSEKVFNDENDWSNIWKDIDKFNNGSEINYYFEPEKVPEYYEEINFNEEEQIYIITYTHDTRKIEKTVEIIWADDNDNRNTRPLSVKIQLYANGEPQGEEIIITNETDWKYTFTLNQNIDGKEAVYTVKQVDNLENYNTTYSEDTFTITNTIKTYNYSVEYYYDGLKDDNETLYFTAKAGDIIESYPGRPRDNYDFIEDNLPLLITPKASDNVIRVYYERKDVNVNIKYIDRYTDKPISDEVNLSGKIGDSYNLNEYKKDLIDYTLINEPKQMEGIYDKTEYEIIFYYAKNSNIIVKYLEKDTNQTLSTEQKIPGYQGKTYNIDHKDIDGYTFINSSGTERGLYQREDVEVIFYYAKNTNVKVKCIDIITLDYLDNYEINGYVGQEYNITPKEISGYTVIRKTDNSTGKMTEIPQEVTIYYAKNTRVVVKYIDKNSGTELDKTIINGYEGLAYKTEKKNISGYTFVEAEGETEGTMLRNEIEVKYYYLQNAKVVIQHIDKISNTILKEESKDGKVGDTIKTAPIDIEKYIFIEGPNNLNVVLTKNVQIIKYYYAHVSDGVVEKHIDVVTNEIISSEKHEGVEGQSYDVNSKNFDGYDIVTERLPHNNKGTMTKDLIEVEYYYIKKATVKTLYIDKSTGAEIAEQVIITGHENDNYETTKKDINNYVFVESTDNTKGQMKVSINPDGTFNPETIVKYFYIKKSAGILEQHIDIVSGEVLQSKVTEGTVGDNYAIYSLNIEGYDIVKEKVPNNAKGQMKDTQIIVKYYYIKKTKVIVKHIDIQTHEELYEETITGHENDKYDTTYKSIDEYDLSVAPTNKSGNMTKEDIIVTYYYIKKAQINVEYVDKTTGEIISKNDIVKGHIGEQYFVKPKDISYYKFVESSNNESGKMQDKAVTVTFYYEKLTFNMNIKYKRIIINGNVFAASHNVYKVEIPGNRIRNSRQSITFIVRVENVGEIEGKLDEIRCKIPYGFEFYQEKNDIVWINSNNILSTTDFKDVTLKPGEGKEFALVLTWNGEKNVLGQITHEISLHKSSTPPQYQEVNYDDNKAYAITIFAVKTGETQELIVDIMMTILVIVLPIGSYIIESPKKNKRNPIV